MHIVRLDSSGAPDATNEADGGGSVDEIFDLGDGFAVRVLRSAWEQAYSATLYAHYTPAPSAGTRYSAYIVADGHTTGLASLQEAKAYAATLRETLTGDDAVPSQPGCQCAGCSRK